MTNAAAVARTLKRAGINTVTSRFREGIHVTGKGQVCLAIQHDGYPDEMDRWATRLKNDALGVLREAGYTVIPNPRVADNDDECDLFIVTKETGAA